MAAADRPLGLPELKAYAARVQHMLWNREGPLWDRHSGSASTAGRRDALPCPFFLDPNRRRFVVVSVDPAGGGELSDEVFVSGTGDCDCQPQPRHVGLPGGG